MPEILAASDACLVHLKRRDLFRTVLPSKIFEAAAMARPIVLGVEGSAAELIREAGAGICIEPENDRELVNTLTSLADDAELSRRIGRQGHDYITTHYNRDKLAGEYLDIVRAVATRTSPQAVKDAQ
jgi:glycosyltransferase involved in cell wall biosynthesis